MTTTVMTVMMQDVCTLFAVGKKERINTASCRGGTYVYRKRKQTFALCSERAHDARQGKDTNAVKIINIKGGRETVQIAVGRWHVR